jgi:HTH-type transcriptional regulator, competence development regulator
MSKLGRSLKDAREAKALTLRAVQEATGVSNPYLSQIESGKVQHPSPTVLNKLAILYGISYASVMKAAGYPVPDSSVLSEHSRALARLGPITQDEEEELAQYLEFVRRRRERGGA